MSEGKTATRSRQPYWVLKSSSGYWAHKRAAYVRTRQRATHFDSLDTAHMARLRGERVVRVSRREPTPSSETHDITDSHGWHWRIHVTHYVGGAATAYPVRLS